MKSRNHGRTWQIQYSPTFSKRGYNEIHAKAKKTGSGKFRTKSLRREIKADIKNQHDLYVNNLVGDVKANPRLLQIHK